jgi:ACS family tartrate transporter-like MFS transporter
VSAPESALDRARRKAYWRLIPLCFICYVIAYVDRQNVAIAKLTMVRDLPVFDNAVFGFGIGMFYWGYVLLEIPGTLLVERWSARKWISRIMVSWGLIAASTALVRTPSQFYLVRFLLGLAEAGFYPGIIVYLTHWFPIRDRARALSFFFMATPAAQVLNPKISNALLGIDRDPLFGLAGWQWVFIAWGIPAVVLGVIVFFAMTDRPRHARWLTPEEREALEEELARERSPVAGRAHMKVLQALRHPKVLLLTATYFLVNTATISIESFLPSILQRWYDLKLGAVTSLVILPPALAALGQLFIGWSSDRTKERRLHAVLPLVLGMVSLALVIWTRGNLSLTVLFFSLSFTGLKAYLPAFWSLPNIFLSGAAAAGSIGLINSFGNLGGWLGPTVVGNVEKVTGSFMGGLWFLVASIAFGLIVLFALGLGARKKD